MDQYDLYDDESGIMTNYTKRGDRWLRKAHITMIGTDGTILADQDCMVGISGGTSSPVKSLKLTALEDEYFDLPIINEDVNLSRYSSVDIYKTIRVESGQQDVAYGGNIRSALLTSLLENTDFYAPGGTQRCIAFLNGKFYRICDLQPVYTEQYLAQRFNLNEEYIWRSKYMEKDVLKEAGVWNFWRR